MSGGSARRVVIEFLGEDKSLSRTMSDVDGNSSRLMGTLGKIGSVAAMGLGALAVGAGAVAVSGAKLEQQYGKTMNLVEASTGAAAGTMKELDALAMKMGAETAFSANDAAGAMLELAKAGIKTRDIMGGGLKGTLLLAAAGGTDLGTAATIASNAMNTFSLKGKDMDKIAAALAGGANASSASVESLGMALQQVGPGASNAGLSMQETVAALSAFDAAGVKGADAGTSLKTMLSRLVPQTEAAAVAMADANLNFVNADGSFKSLTEISGQLQRGLGGLSAAQRTTALNTIFGSDASRAASVLMKEGVAGIQGYIKATNDRGAAQKMADAAMAGSAGAMERLRGSVETLQLQIGKALAPVLIEVANWLSSTGIPAFSGFATLLGQVLPPAFAQIKRVLSTVILELGKLAAMVNENRDVFVALGAGLVAAKVAMIAYATYTKIVTVATAAWSAVQKVLNISLMANPLGLVVAAIGLLVAGMVLAYRRSDSFRAIVDKVGGVIRDTVLPALGRFGSVVGGALVSAVQAGIGILGAIISKVIEIGKTFIDGVQDVARFASGVREKIGNALDFITSIPGKAVAALSNIGTALLSAGKSLIQGLIDGITNKVGELRDKLQSVTKLIPDWKGPIDKDRVLLTPAGEALMEGLIQGIESKKTKLQTVLEKITAYVQKKQEALATLLDKRQSIVDSFKGFVGSVFGDTGEEGGPTAEGIVASSAGKRGQAEQLNADVATLISKGLSQDLINQMISQGSGGVAQINALAGATDEQIRAVNANNAATQAALEAAGLKAADAVIGEQVRQAERDVQLADTIRNKLQELLDKQDKNTIVELKLDGRAIQWSLRKLKRESGENLGLA